MEKNDAILRCDIQMMAWPSLPGSVFYFLSDTKIMGHLVIDGSIDMMKYNILRGWEKYIGLRELNPQLLECKVNRNV